MGAGLALGLAVATLAWWGLGRLEPRATWLRVEAPPRAVIGHPLPMRVHLGPLAEPTCVCVDLHWSAQHHGPSDYLSGGGFKAVGKEGGDFEFDLPVPPREGMQYVLGVIFLSRTGRWTNHTLLANTEHIPVATGRVEGTGAQLQPIGLQAQRFSGAKPSRGEGLLRGLTGLLLLGAAVVSWRGRRYSAGPEDGPATRRRQLLAMLLALGCVWELCGLEGWVAGHVRALARAQDVYYLRAGLQKVAASLIIAGALVMLICVRRARGAERWAFSVLGLYAGFAGLSLISLHAVDALAWRGVSLVQVLEVTCAAVLLGLTQRLRAVARNQAGTDSP